MSFRLQSEILYMLHALEKDGAVFISENHGGAGVRLKRKGKR